MFVNAPTTKYLYIEWDNVYFYKKKSLSIFGNLTISYNFFFLSQGQTQTVVPKPQPVQAQENAALKAEQERINEMKANQELKNMLVKEVNDFQMELYKFTVKTRETQAKVSLVTMVIERK